MSGKATIYDIAKELNISAATVSRALNSNPKISKRTCKLVIETAAKMNYKQNKLALALRSGKSKSVISGNIRTEMEHGKPQKQAIAIAMDKAGMSRKKKRKTVLGGHR